MRGEGKGSQRKRKRMCIDELPKREGMKRSIGSNSKSLSEHLTPLRRYLLKQVGRPWNKVFAEICEHISRDSAVQDHVRDHVFDFVAIHVFERDGVLYQMRWGHETPLSARCFPPYYVCPRSGLLKRIKTSMHVTRRKSKPLLNVHIPVDFEISFIRHHGIWHRLRLDGYPKNAAANSADYPSKSYDALHGERITRKQAVAFYGRPLLAKEARRATRDEIRKHCEPLKAPNRV